ncbi:hypothetical protein MTR_4g010910 [Medicago truncatula]|uniref:Transmembrane protein n=1 Tax=Medicago truncatula TaxID=3880 RepID=A0A072UG68_MEDTR|nr:hypothetical protein MTR_4g010910 [Medicago truncatula]
MCHNRSLKPLSFVALLCCSSRGSLEFSRSTSWRRKSRFCQLHWSHRSSGGSNLYGKLEKKAKVLLVSLVFAAGFNRNPAFITCEACSALILHSLQVVPLIRNDFYSLSMTNLPQQNSNKMLRIL